MVALLVSLVFYRGFRITQTLSVIADALRSAATIMLIVVTALALGHWMTGFGAPAKLVTWTLAHNLATLHFLPASNVCCRAASWRSWRRCCW